MADVLRLLTYANRREVAKALRKKGHKISGETLNRWVREKKEIPLEMANAIRRLYGLSMDTTEKPPPWWEAAQDRLVQEIRENRDEIKRLVDPMRVDVTALVKDMEQGHRASGEESSRPQVGGVAPVSKNTQDGRDATPLPKKSPPSRAKKMR